MNKGSTMLYTTPPYDHQKEAVELAIKHGGFAYFLEQGTGKSKIIIDEIVNLIEQDEIDCAIILAPNNVHINWAFEFHKHLPVNYNKVRIQIWKSGDVEKQVKITKEIFAEGKIIIFLMNIEALSTINGRDYLKRLLAARRKTYMAIDESHKIKTPHAQRTKAAIELGRLAKYRRIATGTEAEEGIHNLFSQFRFLNPYIIGARSYTAFKSMYCVMGGYENREIKGYQNQEILASKIAPYSYQKRKKDCLDLPDKVYVTHKISMTKEQHRIYQLLEDELLMELNDGSLVDATQAMTRLMRLQQVLCGHINNSDGQFQYVPSMRADYVAEIVEEASSKVIVFCRFVRDVEIVCSALAKNEVGSIGVSGIIDNIQRMERIDEWRTSHNNKALVITTATGGTGLTLNEATTTVFYSNSWSATDRKQAEDRNHRIGQNDKVTYHDIIVPNSVDHRLLNVLKSKENKAMSFRSIVEIQKLLTEPLMEVSE